MSSSMRFRVTLPRFFSILKETCPIYHQRHTKSRAEFQFLRHSTTSQHKESVKDFSADNEKISQGVITKVNDQIINKTHGRLFAIVHLAGNQYKITTEDIIVVRGNWPPIPGDEIRLEKVLLVGSSDFTLIGRPLLPLDQVLVLGTVIEKTLSHTYPLMRYRPRKNFMKLNFYRDEMTYLRITCVNLTSKVNELGDTDGLKNRIF